MVLDSYQGNILVSQPKNEDKFFKDSCVLIIRHDHRGAWGVTVNKPLSLLNCDLSDILDHVGLENTMGINAPVYAGGPVEKSRICILHSKDWSSASTLEITKDISITYDLSILAALVGGHGPSKFKVCCGVSAWGPSQLEGEMSGQEPWTPRHMWLVTPATEENIFDVDHDALWSISLTEAVNLEVKEWF